MISAHAIEPPAWMTTLVDHVILPAVRPSGFVGRFAYRAWDPEAAGSESWLLTVFPAPYEIRAQHAQDGSKRYGAFQLDLKKVLASFAEISEVSWHTAANIYNGEEEFSGPRLVISGVFASQKISLHIFGGPPSCEPISHYLDLQTGTATIAD